MNWKKTAFISVAVVFLLGSAVIFYAVFFTTPRMRIQENIRNFEAVMPLAPAESVPLERTDYLPDGKRTPAIDLTIEKTRENIAKGAVYYSYYCVFCHGDSGDGEGPVGKSYMPKPTNLMSMQLENMKDDDLLRAMLLGTGHEPVLNRVVPHEYYGYLVLFVRSLHNQEKK